MSWEQWPFHPRSLTEMIGPSDIVENSEQFISLLVSGCSERLGRALTVVEPQVDETGKRIQELCPDVLGETRPKLRRIDHINTREHFAPFCTYLRDVLGQDKFCQQFDEQIACRILRTATEKLGNVGEFSGGYPCWAHLIDQAGIVFFDKTPVAVVLSGQFLSDDEDELEEFLTFVENLQSEHGLQGEKRQRLMDCVDQLVTREESVLNYIDVTKQRNPARVAELLETKPTAKQLFLQEVEELQRIACAQFQMYRREIEDRFKRDLRHKLSIQIISERDEIAQKTQPILEEVRRFCGASYLALFVSPQRYISYEGNLNLLSPFVLAGVEDEIRTGIMHFNWQKAHRALVVPTDTEEKGEKESTSKEMERFISLWSQQEDIEQLLRHGVKGDQAATFSDSSIICTVQLTDAYRAVLLWGPFAHLSNSSVEQEQEQEFLQEVSELVIMRILSLIQLSDSEQRTNTWGEVATLLSHYSRRVMTPVSTGIRIVTDFVRGGGIYAKDDALNALESLDIASKVIRQAVRAPVVSFAAMTEELYGFVPTSLIDIVNDCVKLYNFIASEKGITINVYPNVADLPKVEIDVAKMRDAIGYVLDNAIKYSHPDPEVRIFGEEAGGGDIRLTISDYGQGIAEEERLLIFGRGYQGARSRKAIEEEGEGMGLFHTRLIVEAHKGRIWCDCRSGKRHEDSALLDGYHVSFIFELPIHQPKE